MSFWCDRDTLDRLEWPRLAECLAREAATRRGAEVCRGELFQPTLGAVRERLAETDEARALLDAGEALPFAGVHDLREVLQALRLDAPPSARALAEVLTTLRAAERLRAFLGERREGCPRLVGLGDTLADFGGLVRALARVVTEEGDVRGDASPELRRARGRVRELEAQIERRMSELAASASLEPHLQDRYVTFREGRPVVPVRADARHRVRGIVHDVSSSGTTVFIEPEAVVEAGNALRLARTEVEREVERLLRELGRAAAERVLEIEAACATLEALDLAQARARLSQRLGARAPALSPDGGLSLAGLRHPLLLLEAGLDEDDVVANDLALPDGARCLVISGPNAGGKTVAAKAVGLAALALRAGLHVPCAEASRMPVFDAVHADIGDDQDLRAGLSTFSARMANLAGIVSAADASTLVIVDEVGEGTEPGEGAALAQAILEALVKRGALVLATTHFNRLKRLAAEDPRFANASAEYDPDTLLPTYRLRIGEPGGSGARWVASRMGMDESVVARAASLLGGEDRQLEELAQGLADARSELEAERTSAQRARAEAQRLRSEYEKRLSALRSEREQVLAEMKAELAQAYTAAREAVAGVVRRLQRGEGDAAPDRGRAANRAHRDLGRIRDEVEALEREHRDDAAESGGSVPPEQLVPGTRVRVEGLPRPAVVVDAPDRRQRVAVRLGAARMSIPAERVREVLEHGPTPDAAPPRAPQAVPSGPPEGGERRCDLRGLRVDEALDRADAHLQRMLGHGEPRLLLIHGHGTGALRSALRAWLRELPAVAEFGPGEPTEGGNGVTFVRLTH